MRSEDLFAPVAGKEDGYKKLINKVLSQRFAIYIGSLKPTEQKMVNQDYSNIMEYVKRELQEKNNDH